MKSVFIFVICLFIISCNGPASRVTHDDFLENAPGDSLHAVRIPIGGDFLGEYPVLTFGERIVMRNPFRSDKCYSIYCFSGDSLVKEGEFLSRGRGPYEMLYSEIGFDPASGSLNLLAIHNQENRFCRVRSDAPEYLYDLSHGEYKSLAGIGNRTWITSCLLDRSSYLMLGCQADSLAMFSRFDVDSGQVTPLGFEFPRTSLDLSPLEQHVLWTGKLYRHPQRHRFVYCAQDFKYLFVFDLTSEGRIQLVRGVYDRLPDLKWVDDPQEWHYTFDEACEEGFEAVAVDEAGIYVVYTQSTHGELRHAVRTGSAQPVRPVRMNVYDWDGNFVRRLVLDRPVGPMVVHDGRLIAWSVDPETAEEMLVSYTL